MSTCEVVIIGAGPAGLFAALSLENLGLGNVLLVEQGPDLGEGHRDKPGGLLCGWGGAGAYSDGKLILSPEVGGFLGDLLPLDDLTGLFQEVDSTYQSLGAPPETHGGDPDTLELLKTKARHAGMTFIPTRLRHIGTENCQKILTRLKERLTGLVEIRTHCRAQRIMVKDGAVTGVVLDNEVEGRWVGGQPPTMHVEQIDAHSIRVKVRVGQFGDRKDEDAIQAGIRGNL